MKTIITYTDSIIKSMYMHIYTLLYNARNMWLSITSQVKSSQKSSAFETASFTHMG